MGQKINSENTINMIGNSNKLIIENSKSSKKIDLLQNFIFFKNRFLVKKISIKLDEKYSPISIKKLEKQVDLIIFYILNSKEFEINIVSSKYEAELKKHSKNLDRKNFFLKAISEKREELSTLSFRMKEFLNVAIKKTLLNLDDLKLIAIGMIERLKFDDTSPQGSQKIDIFKASQDFGCSVQLTQVDVEALTMSLFDLQFSGYDIYDLPRDIRLKKAFPAIIQEFFYQKLDIKDIKKYLYLKISHG